MNRPHSIRAFIALLLLWVPSVLWAVTSEASGRTYLHTGWNLQSSCKVAETGEAISTSAYHPRGWYKASVPTTVVAAQVAAGDFPDPYYAMNLLKLPGMDYDIGDKFSIHLMRNDSPYACSWWYRTQFRVPTQSARRNIWLRFDGINYSANAWINGRKLADAKDVAGTYRTYEFNATRLLRAGKPNVLAIEVFAPTEKDLAINWVDWNPAPPDKNMGLWRGVSLTTSGPVAVRFPQVVTYVTDDLNIARLTLMAEVRNATDRPVRTRVDARIAALNLSLSRSVTLQPGETRAVTFSPEQYPRLTVRQPKLWWPVGMGRQNLEHLVVTASVGGWVSDQQQVRFGMREITSELTNRGHRLFRINGKPILIRGGGWAPDMLLRGSRRRMETEFRYVLDMNLNTIRLEGKLETDEFYDLADEKGVLIMAGWCCCDIWEKWAKWEPGNQLEIGKASLRSQALRMRSHPSMLVWLNGSDEPPPAGVERAYLDVLQETAWPNPTLSSAAANPTTVSGPTGVKMIGPYDWVPPSYWLRDPGKYGGAWGFNTETGPGPAIPELRCLHKFLPADHLWPIDTVWNFHAGGERFQNMDIYNQALAATYGAPTGVQDYATKSQAMAYDGERAMFEAYARNKYTSTGVIQWMLNNAWPSTIWHLYDYYLEPAGGYYGTKKANEPLHIQYSYDDRSVVVVNNTYDRAEGLTATTAVYDSNLKQRFTHRDTLDVAADAVRSVVTIPVFPSDPDMQVYFIVLSLHDRRGKLVSTNFYWLPAKLAVIAWDRTANTVYTPVDSYDDMTALARLPRVRLRATAVLQSGKLVHVKLHNPSAHLAFQVHLDVPAPDDGQSGTTLWNDNYVALLPGDTREIVGTYIGRGAAPTVTVDGWNIEPVSLPLHADARH